MQTVFSDSRKVTLYYHRTLADTPTYACNLGALNIATRGVIYLCGILLLYLSTKKLAAYYSQHFRGTKKNEICRIETEEIELYSIDSIDEFDRQSKTETSNDNVASLKPTVNRRNRYPRQQNEIDDTDTFELEDSCDSNQRNEYPYENEKKVNIYSVVTQPMSSNKNTMNLCPNRSNSTDDDKVSLCSRRQMKDTTKKESNRKLTKDSRLEFREQNQQKNQMAKKMKDRSVNTEIKTFKINDAVSFGDVDSYTDNETDLEKEMVFIDLPANYYYQNRLSQGHPSPCLINLNKHRKRSERRC